MIDYKDPNFKIENTPCFNNIDGYKELSMYLDFACQTTIQRQIPGILPEQESYYVKQILTEYLAGNKTIFTRQFGIRENINTIGPDKIRGILIANMIEKEGFNVGKLNKLTATSYEDQCARYITQITQFGQLNDETNRVWINKNLETLIDCYINMKYQKGYNARDVYEYYVNRTPFIQQAMEKLNLEMKLEPYKK